MQKQIKQVLEFHNGFELEYNTSPIAAISEKHKLLRFNLMKEENDEYFEAIQNNNIIEIADALGDMLYILCGTILAHGLQDKMEAVFDEIHRSNMSKLDTNGKPIYRDDGKVLKGIDYFKPNIEGILK